MVSSLRLTSNQLRTERIHLYHVAVHVKTGIRSVPVVAHWFDWHSNLTTFFQTFCLCKCHVSINRLQLSPNCFNTRPCPASQIQSSNINALQSTIHSDTFYSLSPDQLSNGKEYTFRYTDTTHFLKAQHN